MDRQRSGSAGWSHYPPCRCPTLWESRQASTQSHGRRDQPPPSMGCPIDGGVFSFRVRSATLATGRTGSGARAIPTPRLRPTGRSPSARSTRSSSGRGGTRREVSRRCGPGRQRGPKRSAPRTSGTVQFRRSSRHLRDTGNGTIPRRPPHLPQLNGLCKKLHAFAREFARHAKGFVGIREKSSH